MSQRWLQETNPGSLCVCWSHPSSPSLYYDRLCFLHRLFKKTWHWHGILLGPLGSSRVLSRPLWSSRGLSGPLRSSRGLSGPLGASWGLLGPLWALLAQNQATNLKTRRDPVPTQGQNFFFWWLKLICLSLHFFFFYLHHKATFHQAQILLDPWHTLNLQDCCYHTFYLVFLFFFWMTDLAVCC